MTHEEKWDHRFLVMCELVGSWSKDPSTKCGAVMVRSNRSVAAVGYNGLPRSIEDTYERLNTRDLKLELTVHCEMNALLSASESVGGCTLYTTPCISCCRCAVHMIQAGIVRAVSFAPTDDMLSRWKDSLTRTRELFSEACVRVTEYH